MAVRLEALDRGEFWHGVIKPVLLWLEMRAGRALLTPEEHERFRVEFESDTLKPNREPLTPEERERFRTEWDLLNRTGGKR